MKLALVQLNPTIGDVDRNAARIADEIDQAAQAGVDVAIFPEQALLGYPAKDLLLRRELIERNVAALDRLAARTQTTAAIVGFAEPNQSAFGRPVYNAAAVLAGGRRIATIRKRLLPTYDVFDEARYFEPGGPQPVVELGGRRLGVSICEDLWSQEELLSKPLYDCNPIRDLTERGAELIVNISASPFCYDKHRARVALMAEHARRQRLPIAYVNQVGGNDELIFDGASCLVGADGEPRAQARAFAEDRLIVDLARLEDARRETLPTGPGELFEALVLGLRDYSRKCGFRSVVLGLSGGIDSALVAALAAEALGAPNVYGVALPSRFSSAHSLADARALATALGIHYREIPIEPMHAAFEAALGAAFAGRAADVTEENIQARVRGVVLMALSNKFGHLLLTTGNKSELAVGYCTLYGDMCGGLAVISDVPKTMVYQLSHHINERSGRGLIPPGSLTKPPSAELRPDQTDQDSLPPYEILDEILARFEERLESPAQIVAAGFDARVVADVLRLIKTSEYKRQQAAPGLKVTSRAFGFGRRMPIATRY